MKSFWLTKRSLMVLVISFLIGLTVFLIMKQNQEEKYRLQFFNDTQALSYSLGSNINNYVNVLLSLKSLMDTSSQMEDFHNYNKNLYKIEQLPNLDLTFYLSQEKKLTAYSAKKLIKYEDLPLTIQNYLNYHINRNTQNSFDILKAEKRQDNSSLLLGHDKLLLTYPVFAKNEKGEPYYRGEVGIVINIKNDLFVFPMGSYNHLNYEVLLNSTHSVIYHSMENESDYFYEMPIKVKNGMDYFKVKVFLPNNPTLTTDNQLIWIVSFSIFIVIYLCCMIMFFLSESHDKASNIAYEMTKELRYSAWYDGLTGLFNRSHAIEELNQLIFKNVEQQLLIVCLDLEDFKRVNDSIGHLAGDEILKEYATRLKEEKEFLIVSRMSGDEFMITMLLNEPIETKALKIEGIMNNPFIVQNEKFFINHKFGLSIYPQHSLKADELIKHAEISMYEAKNMKKSMVVYDNLLTNRLNYKNKLRTALSQALDNNELHLVYQPKMTYLRGKVLCKSAEVLCRWESPEFGSVSPDIFITLAEETGDIHRLGQWVVEQSAKKINEWRKLGINSILAINLSPKQFKNPNLPSEYKKILEQYNLLTSDMVLEITENSMMTDRKKSIEILESFHAQGFAISIDDFGKGHSSLSYLKDFPISEIKMDKGFIDDIIDSHFDQILVEGLVGMAKKLGIALVVEGVETQEQAKWLCKVGCRVFQGYYFARPLSSNDYEIFMGKVPEKVLEI